MKTLLAIAVVLLCAGCSGGEVRACKQDCPIEVVPVCAADGKEYDNACTAKCYGTTVQYEGPCKPAGSAPAASDEGDDD